MRRGSRRGRSDLSLHLAHLELVVNPIPGSRLEVPVVTFRGFVNTVASLFPLEHMSHFELPCEASESQDYSPSSLRCASQYVQVVNRAYCESVSIMQAVRF